MANEQNKTAPITAATAEGQSKSNNNAIITDNNANRNKKVKGSSRMISDAIISSGRFLKLSDKAKVLYMYLIVRTDDEGVVEAFPAMMLVGADQSALEELIAKKFVVRLNEDDVVLIKDFFEQNTLRADRTKRSRFHDLIAVNCPQNAADCQPNTIQSNLTESKSREDNSSEAKSGQSKSIQEADEDGPDFSEYEVFNPKEEYVIPYVMDRFGYKYGFSESEVRCLVELADYLDGVNRETNHDPDGSSYEWMQEYFCIKFRMLECEDSKTKIKNKFAYIKRMVENDLRGEGKIPEEYYNTRNRTST